MAWIAYSMAGKSLQQELSGPKVSVGRSSNCGIALSHDSKVSSKHCSIIQRADGFYLLDENSKNGTYLNQKKVVAHEAQLRDGDEIKVGGSLLSFYVESPVSEDTGSGFLHRMKTLIGK